MSQDLQLVLDKASVQKKYHNLESFTPLDKAALFNHIKKHHLCSDKKLIKYSHNLAELMNLLKISSSDLECSKQELLKFEQRYKIGFTCLGDEDYPSSFYHLDQAPSIFYYIGNLDLINTNYNLAVVGTRNSSLYGEQCCRSIVKALEAYDVSFVSGLARGIDLVSHKTALATKASSIAVLGSGLLAFEYYGEQKLYFEELKRNHLVVSDLHPCQYATRQSFALRNRLIAALSNSTVVIEAPKSSGALITADHCLKLERPLFVVPGDLNKKSFEGSNKLLSDNKAKPIFEAASVAKALGLDQGSAEASFINETSERAKGLEEKPKQRRARKSIKTPQVKSTMQDPLIDLLDSGVNDFDLLFFKSHYQSQHDLINHLTELEVQGKVSRRGALFVTS